MTINTKFNEIEVKEIKMAMAIRAMLNSTEPTPKTQEEFNAWCEEIVANYYKDKAKEEIKKQKRIEKENKPGFKAHRNWKRYDTEIKKAREQIKELERNIKYYEKKKAEYAKQYKAETGEDVK